RPELVAQVRFTEWTADNKLRHPVYLGMRDDKTPSDVHREPSPSRSGAGLQSRDGGGRPRVLPHASPDALVAQLEELEKARRDDVVELPDGERVKVTNLHKVFWPKKKLTKGDLFRYYARVAPYILPAIADRPLVMKRFPNGVNAAPFYQHR